MKSSLLHLNFDREQKCFTRTLVGSTCATRNRVSVLRIGCLGHRRSANSFPLNAGLLSLFLFKLINWWQGAPWIVNIWIYRFVLCSLLNWFLNDKTTILGYAVLLIIQIVSSIVILWPILICVTFHSSVAAVGVHSSAPNIGTARGASWWVKFVINTPAGRSFVSLGIYRGSKRWSLPGRVHFQGVCSVATFVEKGSCLASSRASLRILYWWDTVHRGIGIKLTTEGLLHPLLMSSNIKLSVIFNIVQYLFAVCLLFVPLNNIECAIFLL